MTLPLVYLAITPDLARELQFDAELDRLSQIARVERWAGAVSPGAADLAAIMARVDVLISGWGTPPLSMLNDWTPDSRLRMVAHSAGTVKHLVPLAAIERGLLVTHANDALAEAVAEFTLGAIIMARRRAFAAVDALRARRPYAPAAVCHEVRGSTIGVIGASAIGRRVLRLLEPLGVTLLLYDPYCSPQDAEILGAELLPLHDLLRYSDIVTLHAPVTPETIGMLGVAEFAAMRDGALFINTARGRLIDHEALLAELQRGRISALLDVTDPTEPLPADSPFLALENCTVLPHIAAVTAEARRRQSRMMVDEILRLFRGEALHYQVTEQRWRTMA